MTAATVTLGFQIAAIVATRLGDAPGVPLDELRHPRDARLDRALRGGVAEPHVLPFARHAGAEVNVGEDRYARVVEEPPAELLRVGGADDPARLGHVRPGVERAAWRPAGNAGHLVQEPDDEIAPLEKR